MEEQKELSLEELQQELASYKELAQDLQKDLTQRQLAQLAEEEMARFGVNRPSIVWALIDPEQVQIQDGELKGLTAQLEALKAREDTAFLFEEAVEKPRFIPLGRKNSARELQARQVMGLER